MQQAHACMRARLLKELIGDELQARVLGGGVRGGEEELQRHLRALARLRQLRRAAVHELQHLWVPTHARTRQVADGPHPA